MVRRAEESIKKAELISNPNPIPILIPYPLSSIPNANPNPNCKAEMSQFVQGLPLMKNISKVMGVNIIENCDVLTDMVHFDMTLSSNSIFSNISSF